MIRHRLFIVFTIGLLFGWESDCDGALIAFDSAAVALLTVDANSGAGTMQANVGFADAYAFLTGGLAYDQTTRTFFSIGGIPGMDYMHQKFLYTIDARNGEATRVGHSNLGWFVTGLAFDSTSGTLYGITGGIGSGVRFLISIDMSTGADTYIGEITEERAFFHTLTHDPSTNTLFSIHGSIQGTDLFAIDPGTGAGTRIGSIGFYEVGGLAYDPALDILYGVDNATNQLIAIDKATGAGIAIGPVGSAFPSINGLTVGIIPEPSSAVLLMLASVACRRYRSR